MPVPALPTVVTDEPDRVDCLRFPEDTTEQGRLVPAGMGDRIVAAHHEEARRRRRVSYVAIVVVSLLTAGAAVVTLGITPVSVGGTVLVAGVMLFARRHGDRPLAPELVAADIPAGKAHDRYEVTVTTTDPTSGTATSDVRTDAVDDSA